jgi:hypothetical protein
MGLIQKSFQLHERPQIDGFGEGIVGPPGDVPPAKSLCPVYGHIHLCSKQARQGASALTRRVRPRVSHGEAYPFFSYCYPH